MKILLPLITLCLSLLQSSFGKPSTLTDKYGQKYIEMGDMKITPEQYSLYYGNDFVPRRFQLQNNGRSNKNLLWLKNRKTEVGAVMPYKFNSDHYFSREQKDKVKMAVDNLNNQFKDCIEIRPATSSDIKYIIIEKPTDPRTGNPIGTCDSYVGKLFRKQIINLQGEENGYDCYDLSIIMHEFIHALGHFHEQNRPDRNDYINVHFNRMTEREKGNYQRQTNEQVDLFNLPYDYFSIMHYSAGSGQISVRNTDEISNRDLGAGDDLTYYDRRKLEELYNCPSKARSESTCPESNPYAYRNGEYCCKTKQENVDTSKRDPKCDGKDFHRGSNCCKGHQYVKCPAGEGCYDYRAPSCPKNFPFVYYDGEYCCQTKKEKHYAPQGSQCDGGTLSVDSRCCKGDKYVACKGSDKCQGYYEATKASRSSPPHDLGTRGIPARRSGATPRPSTEK